MKEELAFYGIKNYRNGLGDGASRIKANGLVSFLGAKVGSYNSDVNWYKGNARVYGQYGHVTNKNLHGHGPEFTTYMVWRV